MIEKIPSFSISPSADSRSGGVSGYGPRERGDDPHAERKALVRAASVLETSLELLAKGKSAERKQTLLGQVRSMVNAVNYYEGEAYEREMTEKPNAMAVQRREHASGLYPELQKALKALQKHKDNAAAEAPIAEIQEAIKVMDEAFFQKDKGHQRH